MNKAASHSKLTKVSMNLTDRDIKKTEQLREKLHFRTNAEVVSAALSIANFLSNQLSNNAELIIRDKKGDAKVFLPGITENW